MNRVLKLAQAARGMVSPNPLVGAVIVKNNQIVAEGYHRYAGGDHAEISALKKAGNSAYQSEIYINLEPCVHYGRTPPCVDEILKAGIKRAVIGMPDPNPLVSGKGIKKLLKANIEVKMGIKEKECRRLNEVFIKYITTGLPFVTIKSALSLDGKIASYSGKSFWITGEKARRYAHKLRFFNDAVLVGVNTILADNPELTIRLQGKEMRKLRRKKFYRIVVDSKGRIPLNSKILMTSPYYSTIIATTKRMSINKLQDLERKDIEVMILPAKKERVDLTRLLKELGKREITSILIEGGGEVNASLIEENLADKILFFIAPKILGGVKAKTAVEGKGVEIFDAYPVKEMKISRLGDDFLLEGYL